MHRALPILLAVLASVECAAANHLGFEIDAFNMACSPSNRAGVVFSPLSFEIDGIVFAEASDTITRANVSESIGILSGFEGVYSPLIESFDGRTNGLSVIMARAFCVPDLRYVQPAISQYIQRLYRAETCCTLPKNGTESWFKAAMDGEMEDFVVPSEAASLKHYAFHDAVSVGCEWLEPFPTNNSRRLQFMAWDGSVVERDFMVDLREMDVCDTSIYTAVRIPLRDECEFVAVLPQSGFSLLDVRATFSRNTIDNLFNAFRSLTEGGVSHCPVAILLPKLDVASTVDLLDVMLKLKFPTKLPKMVGDATPSVIRQLVRFRLCEYGLDEEPLAEKPLEKQIRATATTRKIVFNRPFVFFVHHIPTATMPIAGVYAGMEANK